MPELEFHESDDIFERGWKTSVDGEEQLIDLVEMLESGVLSPDEVDSLEKTVVEVVSDLLATALEKAETPSDLLNIVPIIQFHTSELKAFVRLRTDNKEIWRIVESRFPSADPS